MPGLNAIARKWEIGGLALPPPPHIRALIKVTRDWGSIGLDTRVDPEPWRAFIDRIDPAEPSRLSRKDLRRLATEIWDFPELQGYVAGLVHHCAALSKRTLDRRLARAYWNRFRPDEPIFAYLGQFCASRVATLGTPWTEISSALPIWDCDGGPKSLGLMLLDVERRDALLRQAKLSLRDMQGGVVEAAFSALLLDRSRRSISGHSDSVIRDEAETILQLAEGLGAGAIQGNAGLIAYALLKPWVDRSAPIQHKDMIRIFLIKEFGDPRTNSNQWLSRANALSKKYQITDATDVFRLLNRWLTERSVELFFEIIADTTERKDHWKARRAFWNAYLTTGAISDAWCILGTQAERHVKRISGITPNDFGKVDGSNIDPGHSALLMKIGDLVIADWSHVGAVRFWKDPNTPALYAKKYYGKNLDRSSGYNYAKINHVPVKSMSHIGKWYRKFSDFIKQETGIQYSGPKGADLWGW